MEKTPTTPKQEGWQKGEIEKLVRGNDSKTAGYGGINCSNEVLTFQKVVHPVLHSSAESL